MTIEEIILKAQANDPIAKNLLIKAMMNDGCIKNISKYLHRNRLMGAEDIQGEFWLGVVLAIPEVKIDVGNPLIYLTYRGVNRVRNSLRQAIQKGVTMECLDCGHKRSVNSKKQINFCSKCQSLNVTTKQNEINVTALSITTDDGEYTTKFEMSYNPKLNYAIDIDINEFKIHLSTQQNTVLDLLKNGNTKTKSRNYAQDIADTLGISPQRVIQHINKIKEKFHKLGGLKK